MDAVTETSAESVETQGARDCVCYDGPARQHPTWGRASAADVRGLDPEGVWSMRCIQHVHDPSPEGSRRVTFWPKPRRAASIKSRRR